MDSLFHRSITLHTKRQICSLLNCSSSSIVVKSLAVQQQTGGVDCGLFAIAFLEFIARSNTYPTSTWFDQSKMRNHALRCLKDDILHPFPETKKRGKRSSQKEFSLELYCVCRMIWTPSDGKVNGKYVESIIQYVTKKLEPRQKELFVSVLLFLIHTVVPESILQKRTRLY